jgi:outer membrane biosynthesis protein TonB
MQRIGERSKVLWAVLASLLVHVVVALSLATFGGAFATATPVEEKPLELTIVDLSTKPPPVSSNPQFMETDESKRAAEPPKEKTFESNANSIAASKLPPTGRDPLPTQEGRALPFVQTETHPSSLASKGAKPQPTPPPPELKSTPAPAPSATPTPKASETPRPTSTPTPVPVSTPEPEQFAMLTATPPPPLREPETLSTPVPSIASSTPPPPTRPRPEQVASSYQAQKEQTRITGRIGKNGASSVDAVETPLGRYKKQVLDAIGSRWYFYMAKKLDLVSIGTAHVEAEVDQDGHVQKLNVISNNANEAFANICLQSFQEAQIPPIPPELVSALPEGRLPMDISFTAFANK